MLRDSISAAIKIAQKELNKRRVLTLRLVHAAITDRDIALRGKGKDKADDEEVVDILAKMVKQREESSRLYQEGGRPDLYDQEIEEIVIIKEFMPTQLGEDEIIKVVAEVVEETEAASLRDMGKVMAVLKERYRGQLDMGVAGKMIKQKLVG